MVIVYFGETVSSREREPGDKRRGYNLKQGRQRGNRKECQHIYGRGYRVDSRGDMSVQCDVGTEGE